MGSEYRTCSVIKLWKFVRLGLQMVERHFEFTVPNPGTYFGPGFENIQGCKLTICKPKVGSSSINLFRYGFYVLTGWLSGTREPVSGHKNCGDVSLVVNDYFIG